MVNRIFYILCNYLYISTCTCTLFLAFHCCIQMLGRAWERGWGIWPGDKADTHLLLLEVAEWWPCCAVCSLQSVISLARRNHCRDWLQQYWKILIVFLVVGLLVIVSVVVCSRGMNLVGYAVFSPAYLRHVGPASLQYSFTLMWEGKVPKGFDVVTGHTPTMPSCHSLNYSCGEHWYGRCYCIVGNFGN